MSFKLIVISSAKKIPNETETITSLFKAGLKFFHLRKPGMKKAEMRKFMSALPEKFHARIVIHSNYELSGEFKLGGIHLPVKERNNGKISRLKGRTFSTSVHLNGDVLDPSKFDYVFMSPVFNSISKKGYKALVPFKKWKNFLEKYQSLPGKKAKAIALGGISGKNILKVKDAGFAGAAMLGAIWASKDPVKAFLKIRSKLDQV